MDCRRPFVKAPESGWTQADTWLLLACVMLVAAGPALGETPREPPLLTKIEVVGDYAGRNMLLRIDGRVEYEGRGQLHPPGMTWTIPTPNLGKTSIIELTIEPCTDTFKADYEQDGVQRALIIQNCDIRLVR